MITCLDSISLCKYDWDGGEIQLASVRWQDPNNYSDADMRCLVCADLVNHPQCLLPPGDLVEEMSDELAHHHTLQLHLVLLQSLNHLI